MSGIRELWIWSYSYFFLFSWEKGNYHVILRKQSSVILNIVILNCALCYVYLCWPAGTVLLCAIVLEVWAEEEKPTLL